MGRMAVGTAVACPAGGLEDQEGEPLTLMTMLWFDPRFAFRRWVVTAMQCADIMVHWLGHL
jgi:hypothetical protein